MIVSSKLERILKESAVAKFKLLPRHISGGTEENIKDLRIVGVTSKIQTGHLPNTSPERHRLSQLAPQVTARVGMQCRSVVRPE
jgi:hypothetical protein